jgi:hypothetical protein
MPSSRASSDATCSGTWLGLAGERFFASGNERTPVKFPAGYGYRVRWYDDWNLLADLMNHSTSQKTVYVQVTYTYRPSWESVKRVRPVWLDIDQCGDSEYSIPAGYSDTHRDWSVNVPGKVVAGFGHLHGHGVAIEATNETLQDMSGDHDGAVICKSIAKLDPLDVHSVLSMSSCAGDPLARVSQGTEGPAAQYVSERARRRRRDGNHVPHQSDVAAKRWTEPAAQVPAVQRHCLTDRIPRAAVCPAE